MFLKNTDTTVYAVSTMLDSYGHAAYTMITPMSHMPDASYRFQLIQRPEGVMHVEYFTKYSDVIRHLKGAEVHTHRFANAVIGLIKAAAGIA